MNERETLLASLRERSWRYVAFWTHPKGGPFARKPFERGFSIVLLKRGFWIGTRGFGIFSWTEKPRFWPRDRKVEW